MGTLCRWVSRRLPKQQRPVAHPCICTEILSRKGQMMTVLMSTLLLVTRMKNLMLMPQLNSTFLEFSAAIILTLCCL
ncbi:unnamed protein product [Gongylonema pulchrum]|uniref:Secreted protein n=1 Tax=Gongylonema pulchrum TaxID=637853 RepID=A0A183DY41_9BILA|nr:unnamed protein product [Gongylonema pulchrum]